MDPILTGFIVYLLVVLVVGVIAYRQTQSHASFILGDRKLGPWVIALSERASGESAWLLVGLPGVALAFGFIELWTVIGCTTGILISWTFVAPRLREFVGHSDSLTLPDFFRQRYPETHEAIRVVASLIITFFFTFYVAAQFNAAGKVLDTTFAELLGSLQGYFDGMGLSMETTTIGMLIGTIIVLFYTAMGGFVAVAWTDVVQGIIMVFTCVVLPITGWIKLGGNDVLLPQLLEHSSALSLTGGKSGLHAFLAVIGGLSWGLGYMGQPHLLMRYMAIRSTSEIRTSRLIAIWWAVPAFWGAFMIGIVGLADPHQPPDRDLVGSARVLGCFHDRDRWTRGVRCRSVRRSRTPDAVHGADRDAGMAGRYHDFRRHRGNDVDCGFPTARHHFDSVRRHLAQAAEAGFFALVAGAVFPVGDDRRRPGGVRARRDLIGSGVLDGVVCLERSVGGVRTGVVADPVVETLYRSGSTGRNDWRDGVGRALEMARRK